MNTIKKISILILIFSTFLFIASINYQDNVVEYVWIVTLSLSVTFVWFSGFLYATANKTQTKSIKENKSIEKSKEIGKKHE